MGENEGNGLTGLDRELTNRFEVFTAKRGRRPEDQTLRTGNPVDGAVVEPVDPWVGRAVVEARHKLGVKSHLARPTHHDPHKIGAVRRRHEIDDCGTAGLGFEFGF